MPALSKKTKAATARRAAQQLAVLIGDEVCYEEDYAMADYAMKKYSSHRRIPEFVLAEIQQQYVVDLEKKVKRKMKK